MRLALVGDIHMYRLFVPPWELAGKALVGHANVWLNRRRRFDRELIPSLVQRVADIKTDLVLLSGDLTSIGVTREFTRLAELLRPLTQRVKTIAVPGNHDRYTFLSTRRRRLERAFPGIVPDVFPAMRVLTDGWRLLAIDTAVPRLFTSRGRAGAKQLEAARELLRALPRGEGLVVLAHYALGTPQSMPPMKRNHQLEDAGAMLELLRECPGPTLFVHGHVHFPWSWRRDNEGLPHVLDINAGAPVLRGEDFPNGQGFWQIDLPPGRARLETVILTRHLLAGDPAATEGEWIEKRVEAESVEIETGSGR